RGRLVRRGAAADPRDHAHRAGVPGGVSAGIRLRYSHLHLSQRCDPPRPLTARLLQPRKGAFSWIRPPQSTLVPALPVSAWAAPASAWASSSATTSPRRYATRRPRKVSSVT